jgi:hypothetical protein
MPNAGIIRCRTSCSITAAKNHRPKPVTLSLIVLLIRIRIRKPSRPPALVPSSLFSFRLPTLCLNSTLCTYSPPSVPSLHSLYILSKGGHPQFKSAPPQLRNIADNQIDCGIADKKKLRNCDCESSKFDFCNSTSLSSFLPVPLLSSPFSSAQDGFKNHKKYF